MKKLLIVLMVVAMASFLFVGCLPGVTPPVDEEEEDEEQVVPTTSIAITLVSDFDITSTSTLYVNKTGAADGLIVSGNASTLAEVKVYIDGVVSAATANVSDAGTWTLGVTKTELGEDGLEKTLYAVASEAGLADATSITYTFVLDTVAPKATELKATAAAAPSVTTTYPSGGEFFVSGWPSGRPSLGGTGDLTAGTWYIKVFGDSSDAENVTLTDPDGVVVATYTVDSTTTFNGNIPGVTFEIDHNKLMPGLVAKVVVGTAIASRATVLFDEEITLASAATDANYIWTNTITLFGLVVVVPVSPDFVIHASKTSYFSDFSWDLTQYDSLTCIVDDMEDLAGNIQTTESALSTVVGEASLTSLAP